MIWKIARDPNEIAHVCEGLLSHGARESCEQADPKREDMQRWCGPCRWPYFQEALARAEGADEAREIAEKNIVGSRFCECGCTDTPDDQFCKHCAPPWRKAGKQSETQPSATEIDEGWTVDQFGHPLMEFPNGDPRKRSKPRPVPEPPSAEYLGCGDGGCVIERPRGQHTNGGCRCLMGLHPNARVRIRKAIKRLRAVCKPKGGDR